VERLRFQPGEIIIGQRDHVNRFYMIANGKVEVVLQGRRAGDFVVATLDEGNFFGEVELVRGGKSIATVRAAGETPVEILAVSRQDFDWVLAHSPLTEESISQIVQKRLRENRAAERRKRVPLFSSKKKKAEEKEA